MKKIYIFIVFINFMIVNTYSQTEKSSFEIENNLFIKSNVVNINNIEKSSRCNKHIEINNKASKQLKSSLLNIPDDLNGRLYRLCKVWGYFKYFNQNKCSIKWDTLLNTTIKQVLLSSNNIDFNNSLINMFNKVGNNSYVANPGLLPDTNLNFSNEWIADTVFSQNVRNFLDTFSLYIYPDTSTCFMKKNDYSDPNYISYIDFRNDIISMSLNFTDEADRLTTMFYYWNVINYFFPYKHIMDQSWDSTLYQFIPLTRQAATNISFHKTFLKLATKINDTHGFTNSSLLSTNFWGGYLPKIYFTRIDSNCVVTKMQNITGVKVGDILIKINGINIHDLEDSLSNYIPASTPAALYRILYGNFMLGSSNSNINCTFLDSANNSYDLILTRNITQSDWYSWKNSNSNPTSYFFTNCDYGYIDMGKLQTSEVNSMYETLEYANAIIFDIRNYPNGTLWDLASLFFPTPIVSAKYFKPALTNMQQMLYLPGWYYYQDDSENMGNWNNTNSYSGKIYILVNQETQSQAEYTCQYLSYNPNAKVIGTQTAGADGNISYITLPNGITTCFTSLGWYYADGYQQQRNGVKIDSIVSQTRNGLRQGRDEILEAAFNCNLSINNKNVQNYNFSVFPNPAFDYLLIESIDNKKLDFSIYNMVGQSIKTGKLENNNSKINISSLNSGIYFIELKTDAITKTIKFVKR